MQDTLARYRVQSENPVYYAISPRILDACVDRERLPAGLNYKTTAKSHAKDPQRVAARVLEHAFVAVAHHLSTPPEARTEGGRRSVRLWDLLEFSVANDGTDFRVEHLSRDPDMSRCLASYDLSSPIGPYASTTAMDPVLAAACREAGVSPSILPGPRGNLVRNTLTHTFLHYVDWNRLRRSLLRFLAPDPLAMSLARRIFDDDSRTIENFNWVGRHARELALTAVEHPRLLPFLRLASSREGSPVANFDRIVADAGMTPSARRKLEEWGFDALSQAGEHVLFNDYLHMLAWIANLLDRLKYSGEADARFCYLAWSAAYGEGPDWYMRALLKEVSHPVDEAPDVDPPPDFMLTAQWIRSSPPEPDENQKRAGWPWIVARAREYQTVLDAMDQQPWPIPIDNLCVDECDVVAIRDIGALREEGDEMCNCLSTMADPCRHGRVAVFSIRRRGERLACFSLVRGEGEPGAPWKLQQIAGWANCPAGPELIEVALRAAKMLNAIPRAS